MSPSRSVAQEGGFVHGAAGSRFRLVTQPDAGPACGTVVFVHAFAEEMNKSRRMSARMARLLAARGWRVVQRDLCGCGDSAGDFADASWPAWIADVEAELAQAASDSPVWLWCLRAGALLAPPVLAGRPHVNLLLWQPVAAGAQHLQQFLRLHAGARIVGSAKASGEMSPAQQLRAGQPVEVAGYEIHPALAQGLEAASFELPADFAGRVVWLEVSGDESPEPSPVALRHVERLRARGLAVDLDALGGPPFWQTQEIEECEALLQRSLALMSAPSRADAEPVLERQHHA
ncbi:MAG TPA: hydrolase 2, exosortase A system-associated [Albitalea sp.]|uniref:hydrolase 2, exosortase A system-associated n=1 Tax=Piscinibacter sp. TaxID=1903157 RepID=UPI002ED4A364